MMRWLILAVVVVAITATSTVLLQNVSSDSVLRGPNPAKAATEALPAPPIETAGPPPKAVVQGGTTFDIGKAAQRSLLKKDFVIKNEGKGDLVLRLETPPCSCTVTNFQGEDGKNKQLTEDKRVVVKPTESVTIHTTWETRTYTGKYGKDAIVQTNDPERPRIVLQARGEVYPAVVTIPPDANFLEVSDDEEEHRMKVAIYSADRPKMKLGKIKSTKPGLITVDPEPLTESELKTLKVDGGYALKIVVKPGMPLGLFNEEVIVETDHPKMAEIKIPVTGKVVGPITVIPSYYRNYTIVSSAGDRKEINLLVRRNRATKFEVAKAPQKLKLMVQPAGSHQNLAKYVLVIEVPPGTPAGEIRDTIHLKTDHPQAKEIEIQVELIVGDAG